MYTEVGRGNEKTRQQLALCVLRDLSTGNFSICLKAVGTTKNISSKYIMLIAIV